MKIFCKTINVFNNQLLFWVENELQALQNKHQTTTSTKTLACNQINNSCPGACWEHLLCEVKQILLKFYKVLKFVE